MTGFAVGLSSRSSCLVLPLVHTGAASWLIQPDSSTDATTATLTQLTPPLPPLQSLDPAKYPLPEPYPYKEAAQFFKEPEVLPADQLPPMKWSAPDEEGLVAFLVGESDRQTVWEEGGQVDWQAGRQLDLNIACFWNC